MSQATQTPQQTPRQAPKTPLLDMDDALGRLLAAAGPVEGVDAVPTERALGRVLAEAVVSAVDVPPLDNSAMDGYAVRAAEVRVDARLPVSQRLAAGRVGAALRPGTAARIFTGAAVPEGADAVVMQEDTDVDTEPGAGTGTGGKRAYVRFRRAPAPGENIRRAGEDIRCGATVLAAGVRLRPQELGLAASVGRAELCVRRRLRVAVFFTGDEIVLPGGALGPGQIFNSNRYTLHGLLAGLGCEVRDLGVVRDDFAATVEVLERAAQGADVVVTSGGVSVGEEDHVRAALEQIGRLELWRIAMKPGKPLAFGHVGGAAFLGLPGNPVSVFATFCLFVRPYLLRRMGVSEVRPARFPVRAAFTRPRPDPRREFLRARLRHAADGTLEAEVFPNQSSGMLTSAVWADGFVDLLAGRTVALGEAVPFLSFDAVLG